MKLAFLLAMIVFCVVLGAISWALFKYSRRGWLIWIAILLAGFLCLGRPIADFMDPWFLSSVLDLPVSAVISGRELSVKGWTGVDRRIALTGTRLPSTEAEQETAKTELLKLLGYNPRVTLAFPQTVRRVSAPWSAVVTSGGVCVNERMLASGLLQSDGTLPAATPTPQPAGADAAASMVARDEGDAGKPSDVAPEPAAGPDTGEVGLTDRQAKSWELGLPVWGRYVLWVLAGFFGTTSLGMVMNRRYHGLGLLLVIAGLAVTSIVASSQSGATVWPPIICLIMIAAFAGAGRRGNEEFLEEHPKLRG